MRDMQTGMGTKDLIKNYTVIAFVKYFNVKQNQLYTVRKTVEARTSVLLIVENVKWFPL